MNWSLESFPVPQGSYRVGSANDEGYSAPPVGRQGEPQPMTRAGDTPLDGHSAPQCGEGSWVINEGIGILPRHFEDLAEGGASEAVLLRHLYSHGRDCLKILKRF